MQALPRHCNCAIIPKLQGCVALSQWKYWLRSAAARKSSTDAAAEPASPSACRADAGRCAGVDPARAAAAARDRSTHTPVQNATVAPTTMQPAAMVSAGSTDGSPPPATAEWPPTATRPTPAAIAASDRTARPTVMRGIACVVMAPLRARLRRTAACSAPRALERAGHARDAGPY
jgi:hypothetical protein